MIKKILLLIFLTLVLIVGINHKKISNLHSVITLFDEDKIVHNFSNMRDAMFHVDLEKKNSGKPLPKKVQAFAASYVWKGQKKSIEDYLKETNTTSLLVLKGGVIVHEDYRLGTKQSDPRISWSMAKSFLSALFGVAVHEGKIKSLNDAVTDYVPELIDSAYKGVPILNVLNMASGVEFDEDYLAFNSDINKMGRILGLGGSMDEFAATLKVQERVPGTHRHYVSIDTHVLGMVLRQATGEAVKELFESQLWSHIEPEGEAYYLTDSYGKAFVLGGLNLTTRDYARFGELFRNKGLWHDRQVIPQQWVVDSTSNNAPPPPDTKIDTFGYGYQWWVPENSDEEFYAGGIYGQFIYVNPKRRTVIVKTSAHREFRDDGNEGREVKHETIEMFRAIANHYSQ